MGTVTSHHGMPGTPLRIAALWQGVLPPLRKQRNVMGVNRSCRRVIHEFRESLTFGGNPGNLGRALMRILSSHGSSLTQRACLAFLLLSFPSAFRAQQDAVGVYKQSKDSVVMIQGQRHIGSGVIVPGGCPLSASCSVAWVVTNYHVVSGESSITAKFASGVEVLTTDVVAADPDNDLVVLELTGRPFAQSELGDSESLSIGQRLIVISNPMGLQGSVSEGLLSAVRKIAGRTLLQISAPISPGSSGGPVFDQQGKVVGIATATMEGAQNVNLAVPSSTIRSLLRNPRAAKLADLSPAARKDDGADGVIRILSRVAAYLANEMTEEAEAHLRNGIQQYEFSPALRLELAKLLIRTGRFEGGLQQLRVTNRLAPDEWLPVALMGHLTLNRWLEQGRLSDRRTAYQIYRYVSDNGRLPIIKKELITRVLERMGSPAGAWASGGQRSYSVTATQDGRFLLQRTTLDIKQQNTDLAFVPYNAEFTTKGEAGRFTGTFSYFDGACNYVQSLQIQVSSDGTFMEIRGTITQVTGVLNSLSRAVGIKSAQKLCKKPGDEGLVLALNRIPRESFNDVNFMLDEDTRALTFK